ncbi:SBBP repeat-containing protein [Mechercharimyces sp. CAU 1602]|uniref:SBBP repeat-containing protein n=1 Tax=Mechercharimyces sp. CAU 1602 TaxID=2973933 RepID=UPI0021633F43|nr:SBBP repeat-containing protein [Mechercharimyces sp. CAU 1602]MCS1351717.1 SBBP repeat-containing protein [Mechercharimyces sp. CAU 1602]
MIQSHVLRNLSDAGIDYAYCPHGVVLTLQDSYELMLTFEHTGTGRWYEEKIYSEESESCVKSSWYSSVWSGVDLCFTEFEGSLKYDVYLSPGAKVTDVRLRYLGATGLSIDKDGNLCVDTPYGELIEQKPSGSQCIGGESIEVPIQFKLLGEGWFGFACDTWPYPDLPLVIDPLLLYSTYVGGRGDDVGNAIAVSTSGHAYVTGTTFSDDYPITTGAFQSIKPGINSAFITQLNVNGTSLIYSTYLGGNMGDFGCGIAVDEEGSAYVTGSTLSKDFPITSGAAQTVFVGDESSVFASKLNASGASLLYSTFIGGRNDDEGNAIAINNNGEAFITGTTLSRDFPVTRGAFQQELKGTTAAFVTHLNDTGTSFLYSTYLGGGMEDGGFGIAVDGASSAYVTGSTFSFDFPVTSGAFQTQLAGSSDAFVTKFNSAGSSLVYSSFLGGSGGDVGRGIAVDQDRDAYVIGITASTDFPVTAGAFLTMASGGSAFVTKVNDTGTSLVYSTYLANDTIGLALAVDSIGNTWITGSVSSLQFPTTEDAFSPRFNGGSEDAFISQLSLTGANLIYSSYLGGSNLDIGSGVAVDGRGNAYVAGQTESVNFPTTPGAFQRMLAGGCDVFVSKVGLSAVQGVTGATGPTGPRGPRGPRGARGPRGMGGTEQA